MMNAEETERQPLQLILEALEHLHDEVLSESARRLHGHHRTAHGKAWRSAANLAQYLALRQHDLRDLQDQLALHGLSSLGRCEGHVLHTLNAVRAALARMACTTPSEEPDDAPVVTPVEARNLLEARTRQLFGEHPGRRRTRIMVTLPTVAAEDPQFSVRLIAGGMDCARINCAHDDAETWQRMIDNVREAAAAAGQRCSILMDLAGRKPRTGPIAAAPCVAHIKPPRDAVGRPVGPAEVLLLAPDASRHGSAQRYCFELPAELAGQLQVGDRLGFDDTRGKSREMLIIDHPETGHWLAHVFQSTWLTPETPVHLLRRTHKGGLRPQPGEFRLGGFAPRELRIRVRTGDTLLLSHHDVPGEPARYDANGRCLRPARIGCVECGTLEGVGVGDPIWIDDGHVGTEVLERRDDGLLLRVTHARAGGITIKSDRGLNFPHSKLGLPTLTDKDRSDLDFVVRHADMVGLSFVETPADLDMLFDELHTRQAEHLCVVAKIENARGVQALPELLLTALGRHPFGLMIARGDLAVELGGERLSEIQEEILWLAEAAHTPVVWATQVLESLAKQGAVSRPELSDAVLGQRAECVMLNKGPYILDALHTLNEVLRRTELRQWKNSPRMRALSIAGRAD
ncbi:pyruvate kinase [Acidihalobacter prosperus]